MRISDWSSDVCSSDLTSGSDRGLLRPMLEQVARRYGVAPARYLADGGFTRNADLDWAFDPGNGGTRVYAPPVKTKHGRSEEHTSELQSIMRISYAVF